MDQELKQELIDQAAHFGVGFGVVLVLSIIMSVWHAAILMAAIAVGREVYQRVSKGNPWYACHEGCQRDLQFWAMGIMAAIIVVLAI